MLKLTSGIPQVEKSPKTGTSRVTFVEKVIKGDTWMVMAQSSVELEDEFSNLYFTAKEQSNLFLMPPFEPNMLMNLATTNNTLLQCVEAMEVNIDGTGHEFVSIEEGQDIDQTELKRAEAFFNEPYPNATFITVRRKLRRQLEQIGYAYLEILRNLAGDIVGLRNIETNHVRMVKLDAPIQVQKIIERDGKEVELTLWVRERRFAQTVGMSQMVYYREFGTTRQVHRTKGLWESQETPVAPEDRGSELLMFGIHPDVTTPYYLPRWINQLPSVLGSRKAEEQNLEFLDAGGMPPAIVFIQGGTLVKDTSDQLKMYLSGMNKNKHRAVVVEVQSSSGSLDSAAKVDTKVERFGAEQAKDAMFMQYDESTEEHVRCGFRLPPLFLGKAVDYNFATAKTSYMVAEAQVFLPERTEFDALINRTLLKEMGLKSLKFKSMPITLQDVETQLKGLGLAGEVATRESFLEDLNTVASLSLEMAEVPAPNVADGEVPLQHTPTMDEIPSGELPVSTKIPQMTAPQPAPQESKQTPQEIHDAEFAKASAKEKAKAQYQKKTALELIELAQDFAAMQGLVKKRELTPERATEVQALLNALSPDDERAFNNLLATYTFGADEMDLVLLTSHAREQLKSS